jgi:multidrug transporter EmrE-like cation transporter
VNLHGRSLRERAELLIGIAHPDFRAILGIILLGESRSVVRLACIGLIVVGILGLRVASE